MHIGRDYVILIIDKSDSYNQSAVIKQDCFSLFKVVIDVRVYGKNWLSKKIINKMIENDYCEKGRRFLK